jgi:hypothetical protein
MATLLASCGRWSCGSATARRSSSVRIGESAFLTVANPRSTVTFCAAPMKPAARPASHCLQRALHTCGGRIRDIAAPGEPSTRLSICGMSCRCSRAAYNWSSFPSCCLPPGRHAARLLPVRRPDGAAQLPEGDRFGCRRPGRIWAGYPVPAASAAEKPRRVSRSLPPCRRCPVRSGGWTRLQVQPLPLATYRSRWTRSRRARSRKAASPPSRMSQTALRIVAFSSPPAT